jgi:hypothetical protein
MASDVVVIGTKTMTRSRALALGLVAVNDQGETVTTAAGKEMENTVGQKAAAAKARDAEWRRRQGLPPIEEPATTEDGLLIKPKRAPKALKPKNVTPDGVPVEDEETLAQIEARTAAIEKAHLAALAAEESDG